RALRGCPAAAVAGAHAGAPAGVLRLGGAGLPLLRRLRTAGAGGGDLVDLCRALDPRVRLVAHGAVGCGVAGRRACGSCGAADRAAPRPARLAPRVVGVGAGQRPDPDGAFVDPLAIRVLSFVLLVPV